MSAPRIAITVSHPIQHFCPMYADLAACEEWDLNVFFASSAGVESYEDTDFGQEIQWEGITLDFPHEFLNDGKALESSSALDVDDLEEHLDAYAPDALILYGYFQKFQRRALRWADQCDVHTFMISDSERRQHRPLHRRALKEAALPWIYGKVDGFLTKGDANEAHYRHYGARDQHMFRMPYTIDTARFGPAYEKKEELRKEVRERHGIAEDTLVCSFVGKLIERKRPRDIVQALQHLSRGNQSVAAFIIGSGPQEDELSRRRRTVSDPSQTVLTGFVQPNELPAYYAASDLYVHPASEDPHPLSVSEAMFMGNAVIVSDRCGSYGPTDDVQPGRNGLVYECGNVPELAEAIERLRGDRALLRRFSEASRKIAVRNQQQGRSDGLRAALVASGLL